jgi:hypothetical protein
MRPPDAGSPNCKETTLTGGQTTLRGACTASQRACSPEPRRRLEETSRFAEQAWNALSSIGYDRGDVADDPGACSSGTAIEEYSIELPKAMKVMSLPDKAKAANSVQRFEATYTVKGNVLQARRMFEDKTAVAVCPPDVLKAYRHMNGQVYDNLKAQVLYK